MPASRSKVYSEDGGHVPSSCGLYMGTSGCLHLCTHGHAPHIGTHQKEKPRMLPQRTISTTYGTLMTSANSIQKPVAAIILGILLINALRCVIRSGEWRSEDRLFRSALSVCPLNAKVPRPLDSLHWIRTCDRGSVTSVKIIIKYLGEGYFFSQ